LFITHDLKVACYFCDRIGVMYRGELMEEAPAAELYKRGLHPYTKLLFSMGSVPVKNVPPLLTTDGCPFAERCPIATERCLREHPNLVDAGAGHKVRCFKGF
jgi:oligopeptide/dipeptide ABC transporter ATP-binding protein